METAEAKHKNANLKEPRVPLVQPAWLIDNHILIYKLYHNIAFPKIIAGDQTLYLIEKGNIIIQGRRVLIKSLKGSKVRK